MIKKVYNLQWYTWQWILFLCSIITHNLCNYKSIEEKIYNDQFKWEKFTKKSEWTIKSNQQTIYRIFKNDKRLFFIYNFFNVASTMHKIFDFNKTMLLTIFYLMYNTAHGRIIFKFFLNVFQVKTIKFIVRYLKNPYPTMRVLSLCQYRNHIA